MRLLFGRRIDDVECVAGAGLDPSTVDVELLCVVHGTPPGGSLANGTEGSGRPVAVSKPGPAGPAASRGRSGRRGGSVLRRETGRPLESPARTAPSEWSRLRPSEATSLGSSTRSVSPSTSPAMSRISSTADVSSTISTPSSPASVHRSRSLDSPSFASSSRWTCTRRLPPMGLRTRETSSGRFRSSPDTTSPSRPRRSYATVPTCCPRSTAPAVLPS